MPQANLDCLPRLDYHPAWMTADVQNRHRLWRALLRVGLEEWLVIVFLLVLAARLAVVPGERGPLPYLGLVAGMLVLVVVATGVYRWRFEGRRRPRTAFRVALIAGVAVPYGVLRDMIPVIHPGDVDAGLAALDLALFGGHAAVGLERFATPFASAWFAVSYVGYYPVAALFLVGMLLFCRRHAVFVEFGVMVLGVICTGIVLYTFFPAQGPYVYLAESFQAPLPEQAVVPFVHGVMRSGPLRDVFPSMHTAVPVLLFLFSARHVRWAAVAAGLWVPHIVVSTMYLRYHYLIDVVAGVVLAVAWFVLSPPAIRAYQRLRRRHGVLAEA